MLDQILARFRNVAPAVDFWSIRIVDERSEGVAVRRGELEPLLEARSIGAMITVADGGGHAYAATGDLTAAGLRAAAEQAAAHARASADLALFDAALLPRPPKSGL